MSKKQGNSTIFHFMASLFSVIAFIYISPFKRGLFNGNTISFEGPLYGSFIFSSLLLMICAVYFFNRSHFEKVHGQISLLVCLLPISYLLSYLFAISSHLALHSVFIYVIYTGFFISTLYLTQQSNMKNVFTIAVLGSGYLIVIFGFMNWFDDASLWGLIHYNGLDVYQDAVMPTAVGLRLSSVFQYANTYAGLLIGIYLMTIIYLLKPSKWYVTMAISMFLVPILLSLILTQSRAGYLLLPLACMILLPLLTLSRQITIILYTAISGAATLLLLPYMTSIAQDIRINSDSSLVLKGWLLLILGSFIVSLIILAINLWFTPWLNKCLDTIHKRHWLSRLGIPAITLFCISVMALVIISNSSLLQILPSTLGERIQSINLQQHSLLERGTFYKDSFKIISDYPILGTGGGGWSTLYREYQNHPYISAQAHNFLLQSMIEAGVLGFALLALVMTLVLYPYIRDTLTGKNNDLPELSFFGLLIGIFLHSIIDFDMSFVYIGTLFFISLGVLASNRNEALTWPWIRAKGMRIVYRIIPYLFLALSIVVFTFSTQKYSAHELFLKARSDAENGVDFSIVEENLNQAIRKHPDHPAYLLQKADYYLQAYEQTDNKDYINEANKIINHVRKLEPYLYDGYRLAMKAMTLNNAPDIEFVHLTETYLEKFPWDMSLYERAMVLHNQLYLKYVHNNETSAQFHKSRIEKLYNEIIERANHLTTLPEGQLQGQPFEITPVIIDIVNALEVESRS